MTETPRQALARVYAALSATPRSARDLARLTNLPVETRTADGESHLSIEHYLGALHVEGGARPHGLGWVRASDAWPPAWASVEVGARHTPYARRSAERGARRAG